MTNMATGAPKGKVSGEVVVRDKDGNIKYQGKVEGETLFTEEEFKKLFDEETK